MEEKGVVMTNFHTVLVQTVKELRKICDYTDDLWISFCHNWNPEPALIDQLTLDPARYELAFLSDFLADARRCCADEATYEEFRTRLTKKARRAPIWEQSLLTRINNPISAIFICVGQGELHGSTRSRRALYHEACVALPSCYVTHAGAAVSQLLHCLDSGLVTQTLGFQTTPNLVLGCIHSESGFQLFPRAKDKAHVNRLDNMCNVLRAFGVDAFATRRCMGIRTGGGFFDPRLKHFVGVAAGADSKGPIPCFHVDTKALAAHMKKIKQKCLVDDLFKHVVATGRHRMGISRWYDCSNDIVFNVLDFYRYNKKNTLVLRLTSQGTELSSDQLRRREPHKILIPRP